MIDTMPEPTHCPQCGKPRRTSPGGSFTQWIFDRESCSCSSKVETTENRSSRLFCRTCQGSVEIGRQGSLTQWIFTAGKVCKCTTPDFGPPEEIKSAAGASDLLSDRELDDVELCLDPEVERHFPKDRYMPIEEIGRGASSTVYLCRDRLLDKRVAVKILKNVSDKQLIAFQNEARSTSNLSHPVILTLLDFGPTAGAAPYMVHEYFAGITLQQYLEQHGPLTSAQFCLVFEHLAHALAYAHSKDIMHRDIKPSNILVGVRELQSDINRDQPDKPPVRLIDFGLACLANTGHDGEKQKEQSASIAGTPAYMAPDAASSGTYDERSEIYSLGCVMFESLTGQQPFLADTALELLHMHASRQAPSLSFVTKTAWADQFEQLIARCLNKDPEDRFADMDALNLAITNLPHSEEDPAVPESLLQKPEGDQTPDNYNMRPPRFNRAVYAIIFGAVLLSFAAVAFYSFNYSPSLSPSKSRPTGLPARNNRGDDELKEINQIAEKTPPPSSNEKAKRDETENNIAMANRYYHGQGVSQDYPEAFKLYLDAAKTGNGAAQESVGYMLERGLGMPANPAEALLWYEKSANQGNPVAQLNLGTLYLEGRGTALNYDQAMRWFTLSAKQGNARAQNNIGYMYENGLGVEQNYEEARKRYRDAGDKGEPMAYVNLGYLHERGRGGKANYKEAFRCYKLAAKSDIASGIRRLARLILVGRGTKVDFNEAYRLFLRAAQKGDAAAMRWLGFMTLNGQAVPADEEKAFSWYQKAARLNDAESQCQLARMYEKGLGTRKDLAQARHWYQQAAARGEQEAADILSERGDRLGDTK